MGSIQSLADILALLRRRFLPIAVVATLGTVLTLMVAVGLPQVYEAAAVLQVELPRVSAGPGGEAASRSSQRLQLLEQELTSRDSLLELIARHRLFADAPALSPTQQITLARQSIRFEAVRSAAGTYAVEQPVSALLIITQAGTAQQAADLANDLAQRVLATTSERQSEQLRETLEFFAGESTRIAASIGQLQQQIADFKNDNITALPEAANQRESEIASIDATRRELELEQLQLQQQRDTLATRGASLRAVEQRQIGDLDARIGAISRQRQLLQDQRSVIIASVNRAPMVEAQLAAYTRELQQLQEQFTAIERRRAEAETSHRLDSDRQTERFHLLESALPPDYPLASGRRKLVIIGVFASLMLGLGLALLLEWRRPVLRSARQLERATGLHPVIALPDLPPPRPPRSAA